MNFKIRVAKTAGFCFGVRRALEQVLKVHRDTQAPVHTLGPLIHNEQVLAALESQQITPLDDNESPRNKTVVIRAHGVTPMAREVLKANGACVFNATCPRVSRVQGIVKKYSGQGYQTIIVGDEGHAEVEGIKGYARNGIVVSSVEDAEKLPEMDRICVVAQTTQSRLFFQKVVDVLKLKATICEVYDTICDATEERQQETLRIAAKSDLMIVVGGTNSANTKRLAEIASAKCKTILVNTAEEIHRGILEDVSNIGITAGASTPAWVIRDVVERVKAIGWQIHDSPLKSLHRVFSFLHRTQLLTAMGLGVLTFALSVGFAGILKSCYFGLATMLTAVSCSYLDKVVAPHPSPLSYSAILHPLRDHRGVWNVVMGVSLAALLISSYFFSKIMLLLLLLTMLLNLAHVVPMVPTRAGRISGVRFTRLRDLPYAKDAFRTLSDLIAVIGIPHAVMGEGSGMTIFWLGFVGMQRWISRLTFDAQNMQVDLISGKDTLPLMIGKKRIQILLMIAMGIWITGTLSTVLAVGFPLSSGLLLLLIPAYYGIYLLLYHRRMIFLSLTSDLTLIGGLWWAAVLIFVMQLLDSITAS